MSHFAGTHYYQLNINGTWQIDETKEKTSKSGKLFNVLRVNSHSGISGEEFTQYEPLTTRLRNILRQYPGF
jgi:hypothetical protein